MSLATGDLTTLATAQSYLTNAPTEQVLSGLITRISRMILGCLNRPLLVPKTYVDQRDGSGTQQLVLPNYPLLSISSLKVSGVSVPIAPQINDPNSPPPNVPYGYRFPAWDGLPPGAAQAVELSGLAFLYGRQNIVTTYSAGYQVTGEAQTIPTTGNPTITPAQPYGVWASDQGVTTTTGTALVAVSGTPNTGEYSVNEGTYVFAAADAGTGVLISYGFIPADVEQVCLELIAERSSYRQRVGIRSQMLAGQETIAYDNSAMSRWAIEALLPYVSPLPPNIGATV